MKEMYRKYLDCDHGFDKTMMVGIICLLVVVTGFYGWLYEYIFYFFNGGMKYFYWRGGNFLPWINIYAIGSLLIFFVTYRMRKHPLKVFLVSLLLCGFLEFFSGLGMYVIGNGWRCWDYNQEIWNFGNIYGFVCLRSVLFFGLSGLVLIYFLVPVCFYIARKMNRKLFLSISIGMCLIVLCDEIYNLVIARVLNLPRAYDVHKAMGMHYVKFK